MSTNKTYFSKFRTPITVRNLFKVVKMIPLSSSRSFLTFTFNKTSKDEQPGRENNATGNSPTDEHFLIPSAFVYPFC